MLVPAEFGMAEHYARLTAKKRAGARRGMTAENETEALAGICERLKDKRKKIADCESIPCASHFPDYIVLHEQFHTNRTERKLRR